MAYPWLSSHRSPSGNRHLIKRSGLKLKCSLAAASAVTEAKSRINIIFDEQSNSWPEFFKKLLPPDMNPPSGEYTVNVGTSAHSFADEVYIEPVKIRALIKHIHKGAFQGLLSFTVVTEASISTFDKIKVFHKEHVRFVATRSPRKGLSIILIPVPESVLEWEKR